MDEYIFLIPAYFALGTGGGMLLTMGLALGWQILGVVLLLCAFACLVRLFK